MIIINLFTLLMIIVCIFIIFFLVKLHSSKVKSNVKKYFVYSTISILIWCVCFIISISTDEILVIKFFYTMIYIGTTTVSVFYFLFVLAYTKSVSIKEKPYLRLLFIPAIIIFLLALTNDINGHLVYSKLVQYRKSEYLGYYIVYGPIYYMHFTIIIIFNMISILILFQTYFSTPKVEKLIRKQLLIIILTPIIPILFSIIRLFSFLSIVRIFDLSPLSFGISFIFLYLALYRYNFLDINPLAQKYIFDGIKDGLLVLDTKLKLLHLNKAAIEVLIIKSDIISSLYGNSFIEILKKCHSQTNYIKNLENIIVKLKKVPLNNKFYYEDIIEVIRFKEKPDIYFYNIIISPILKKEILMGFIAILRDISDSFKAQNYLNKKNNLHELIFRLLSHDLANHIQVLNFNSEFISHSKEEKQINQANQLIKVKINAISNLTESVLNFLREQEKIYDQKLEVYNFNLLIEEILKDLEPEFKKKDISVILNKSEELTLINANITIKSAIFNIFSNAIKFSPQKGKISINFDLKKHSFITLKISDQGKGIPDEIKEKVFEPFVSYGEEKGTGLGLTIAREVVHNFNGRVWVEDNNPTGTIVCIELPLVSK